MAEDLAHILDGVRPDGDGGESVAEVMESDRRKLRHLDGTLPGDADGRGIVGLAVVTGEDQPGQLLPALKNRAVLAKDGHGPLPKRDGAGGIGALRRLDNLPTAWRLDDLVGDAQRRTLTVKVDGRPHQAERLRATHPGEGKQVEERVERVAFEAHHHVVYLFGRPGAP